MKKVLLPTICILLCALCIVFVPTEAEAAIYEDTIRLHILAPSDSTDDQMLKLKIRDNVLKKYGGAIKEFGSVKGAENEIARMLSEIEKDCNGWLEELGSEYEATVTLGKEWYDTRQYASFTLPAGVYSSLKITIGSGKGQNWWCVMYPPMCLDAATAESSDYTPEEQNLISNDKYRVKFKLLEATAEVFKKRK